ncbi:MAG: SGNH/GDSL hydrolase family protein [Trueperaceae bacterium]
MHTIFYAVQPKRYAFALLVLTLLFLAACGVPAPSNLDGLGSSWVKVADEKNSFSVSGTKTVRYGIDSRWVEKTVTNSGYCGNWFFGNDPADGVVKRCEVLIETETTPAPAAPASGSSWVKIADEKLTFTLSGTQTVRFGSDTRWVQKTVTGKGSCTSWFFGKDPASGTFKRCEMLAVLTPAQTPSPTPNPSTNPTTPMSGLSGIGFLGDSNTEIYYLAPQKKDYASLVAKNLGAKTYNYGEGGQTTRVYLGSDRMKQWKAGKYAYYVITFGLNDARYITTEQFKKDTLELLNQVKSIGAVPILATNVHVDHKGGHYEWDYNVTIKKYDDVYRAVAKETGVALIDVNAVFKGMNDAYNAGDRSTVTLDGVSYQLWDTRIRNTSPVVLDNRQDSGKGMNWYNNIHYNAYGSKVVADQITKHFRDKGVKF